MDLSYSVAHTFPTPVEFGARKWGRLICVVSSETNQIFNLPFFLRNEPGLQPEPFPERTDKVFDLPRFLASLFKSNCKA